MSDNVDVSSEYLSFGFCRETEIVFKMYIPDYIMKLVHKYNVKYIILANGKNAFGQFGIGTQQTDGKWIRLRELEALLPSMQNIFINYESIFVVDAMQNLYAAGSNRHSRLGIKDDETHKVSTFTKAMTNGENNRIMCSSGSSNYDHTFIYLVDSQKLYANGRNYHDQFGDGSKRFEASLFAEIKRFWTVRSNLSKIVCSEQCSLFLVSNGDLYGCGNFHYTAPTLVKPYRINTNVEDIDAGYNFYAIVFKNGELELGGRIFLFMKCDLKAVCKYFKDKHISIKMISCGAEHAAILSTNHECFTFGCDTHGECGTGSTGTYSLSGVHRIQLAKKESVTKVSCGRFHSLLLTNKNNVYGFGKNEQHQISTLNQKSIVSPYLLDKQKELNLDHSQFISDVLAIGAQTLIFVDPSKRVFVRKNNNTLENASKS